MEENRDVPMHSSSGSDSESYSNPVRREDRNRDDGMDELGIFSSALGGTDLSDSDSDESQLEDSHGEGRSFSEGEDEDDPEWLPERRKKEDTRMKHRPSVLLDSEFELFRQIENDLFQDKGGLDLNHPYGEVLPDSLKEELALCYESFDSEVDEGDMSMGEIAEQASKFFSELHQAGKAQRKLLMGFDGPFINKNPQRLPAHLEPVMGSANLAIAQQKFSDAIDLCNEVIRQAPCCSEPYINLALIYKELDDIDRYFQFTLLALHIKSFDRSHPRPEDAETWEQLGIIARERGDLLMALECLKKSLQASPRQSGVLWLQGEIRLELKQNQAALRSFQKIEKLIQDKASYQELCEITRRQSLIWFDSGNIKSAIEVVFQRLRKGWEAMAVVELFNLLLELLFIEKDYVTALKTAVILFGNLSPGKKSCEEVETQDLVEDMDQTCLEISEGILITGETQTIEKKENTLELFFKDFWPDSSLNPAFEAECSGGFLVMVEGNQVLIPTDSFTELPLDLQAKLAIPSVHTGNLELAHHLITHALRNLPIGEYGDLWLDVCESLMECGQCDLSVDLLRTVLGCERYNEPGVWLMLARSLEAVSVRNEVWEDFSKKPILDEAIEWYRKVLADIPDNVDSRILLAGVYHRKGMKEEAISILAEGQQGSKHFLSNKDSLELKTPPDIRVVYRRTMLHLDNGEKEHCLDGFLTLLDYYFREVYLLKSFQLMVIPFLFHSDKSRKKIGKAAQLYSRYEAEEEGQDHYLTLPQWYDVFKSTCKLLGERNKREELFRLIIAANMIRKFHNTQYMLDIQLITVSVCIMQRSLYYAYRFCRPLMHMIRKSNTFANLFNCINENQYLTRNLSVKSIRRMWFEDPGNHRIAQVFALSLLSVGSFHISLLVLHETVKLNPDNPRLLFFMGMAYIRLANNRTYTNKNAFISQAFALIFKYKEKMGDCAEVFYNTGRAFHAIGFKHWASHYYQKVLSLDTWNRVPTGQKLDLQLIELSSLKREAGFNLALIYEESGSIELSRDILQRYCVV